MIYSLSKTERLCSQHLFQELLASQLSFVKYPFRIVCKISSVPTAFPARMAVSVSKKKFKRAVKRNRIKRLTREAYRLHKNELYRHLPAGQTIDMLFIYIGTELPAYAKTEKAIKSALHKIPELFSATT